MKFSIPKIIYLLVLCLFLTNQLFSQDIFETHDSYAIGPGPTGLKAGDFNNDGFMDMVSANSSPLTNSNKEVSILINDGQGDFNVSNIDLDPGFNDLEIADFNKDGNLDFVVISSTDDEMMIFLGIGDGTFTSSIVNVSDSPNNIAVGDFDEDTNPDIAVLRRSSDDIQIYYGDGSGSVGAPQVVAVETSAAKMTVADFNNDDHLDLLTGGNSTAEFHAGDGSGNFAAAVPSTGFFGFDNLNVADLNNDGNLDLVVAATISQIALGAGDGTFSGPTFLPEGKSISLVDDFDNDGNIDLVFTLSHKIIYYPGDGSGVFTKYRRIPMEIGPSALTAADWDDDGNLDLAAASNSVSTAGLLQVVFGKGDGYFIAPHEYPIADNPRGITKGDFDEDGLEDFAICTVGSGANNLYIFLGQSDGTFTNTSIFDGGAFPEDIKALHINGDVHTDLAVLDRNNNVVNLYSGDGTGSFSFVGNLAVTSNFTLAVDDVNKDNITDLILAGNTSTTVQIFEGNGDNTFSFLTDVVVGEAVSDAQIALIDGDTNPDLIIVVNQASGDDQVRLYQGDGLGGFTPVGSSIDLTGGSANGKILTPEDLNNDGLIDFIAVGSGGTGHILIGDGLFGFSQTSMAGGIGELKSAGAADFDGDGIKDLVYGTDNLVVSPDGLGFEIYKGNGDGSFGTKLFTKKFVGGYRMIISDFNDDSRNDIATLVNNGVFNGVSILLNNTSPPTCETPLVTVDPVPTTLCENGPDHVIFVNATGEAPLTYQWQKDGVNIPGAPNSGAYTISNYTSSESGVYRCIVSNSCGNDTSSGATITINSLPPSPGVTSAADCNPASVTLTASGSTDGNYRWYDVPTGGSSLAGEVNSSFTTPTLSVTTDYYVAINDGACESSRTMVTATILEPASITTQPEGQNPQIDDDVTLTVVASGDNLTYQWQKNGTNLTGETSTTFVILNFGETDQGDYTCIVSNECSSETSNVAMLLKTQVLGHSDQISNSIVLYPSPSSGLVHLEGYLTSNLNINIYSLQGQVVYSGVLKPTQTTIDLSNLPDGIYTAAIGNGKVLYHKRILVRK